MGDDELKELIFRICISRSQGDSHIAKGSLRAGSVQHLLDSVEDLISREPLRLDLHGSFVVVGDLHGNIDDLLRVFRRYSYPPKQCYLFLGDYVDRGNNSIETILLLYALKVLFPASVFLLRGNHECEAVSKTYGFKEECNTYFKKRRTYHRICQTFAQLPIAAVLNDHIFCVHGGLSPSIQFLSDLTDQIHRPVPDLSRSVAEDLLWSDPSSDVQRFGESPRKIGCLFGREIFERFLDDNGLSYMIRAHEFCAQGTKVDFGACRTVFSASDYLGRGNSGAVAIVEENGAIEVGIFEPSIVAGHRIVLPPWIVEEARMLPLAEHRVLTDIVIDISGGSE
jgi:protein phosphatase